MQNQPSLIDVSCLCDDHVNEGAEELLLKAIGDPPDNGIWDEHPNPVVRRVVELFTERGLSRIGGLQSELERWLAGDEFADGLERPQRPLGVLARWSPAELGTVRLYLSRLPPAAWELEDWLMLVDYLVQRYLPADSLRTEADWLATRSAMMGRIQAAAADVSGDDADTLLQLPDFSSLGAGMTTLQRSTIAFGRERCCEHVTALADSARHKMRGLIVDYQQAVFSGDRRGAAESLQGRLLDTFGTMNRDWRRIAVTEATENVNQGYVASMAPGSRIKRVERYRGACAFCRSIHNREFTVVEASKPDKNGDTEVWVGKTNVGRSASPQKRVGGEWVDRDPSELWWPAAGAMHPHCRGSWVKVTATSADPEFERQLEAMRRSRGAS